MKPNVEKINQFFNSKSALLKEIKILMFFLIMLFVSLSYIGYNLIANLPLVRLDNVIAFIITIISIVYIEFSFGKRKHYSKDLNAIVNYAFKHHEKVIIADNGTKQLVTLIIMEHMFNIFYNDKYNIAHHYLRKHLKFHFIDKLKNKSFTIPVPDNLWCSGQIWTNGHVKAIIGDKKVIIGTYFIDIENINPINENDNKLIITFNERYIYFTLCEKYLAFKTNLCVKNRGNEDIANRYILVTAE